MIVFGWFWHIISSIHYPNLRCGICKEEDKMHIIFLRQFFYILFIFIPISKKKLTKCTSCGAETDVNLLSPKLQMSIDEKLQGRGLPWFFWLGNGAFIAIILTIIFTAGQAAEKRQEMLQNPQIGDAYIMELEDNYFGIMLLKKIDKDTLLFQTSQYMYSPSLEAGKQFNRVSTNEEFRAFFDKDWMYYLKSELDSLMEIREIADIIRPTEVRINIFKETWDAMEEEYIQMLDSLNSDSLILDGDTIRK